MDVQWSPVLGLQLEGRGAWHRLPAGEDRVDALLDGEDGQLISSEDVGSGRIDASWDQYWGAFAILLLCNSIASVFLLDDPPHSPPDPPDGAVEGGSSSHGHTRSSGGSMSSTRLRLLKCKRLRTHTHIHTHTTQLLLLRCALVALSSCRPFSTVSTQRQRKK